MDVRAEELLRRQASVVAAWQLMAAGVSVDAVRHLAENTRAVGDGVYLTGHGPMSVQQRRWAAVLGAPRTYLALASAADAYGIRPRRLAHEIVVRPGSGGPRRLGDVLVCRSTTLAGDTTTLTGLPTTTPERTIVDLAAHIRGPAATKMVREAIRLQHTTMPRLQRQLHRARGRRGIASLREYVERFGALPFARCRSDAEAMGLQALAEHNRP